MTDIKAQQAVAVITTVHAPADKRHPIALNQLPKIMLEAHNALTAIPDGFGEDGEFRLLKATTLENGDVSLFFELGAPAVPAAPEPEGGAVLDAQTVTLEWAKIETTALEEWRAEFGDYVALATLGHDNDWTHRVNNSGRMGYKSADEAKAAALADLQGRLSIRLHAARKTVALYDAALTPKEASAATVEGPPREPTQTMMDALLYHSSKDTTWADAYTMWTAAHDTWFRDGADAASITPAATGAGEDDEGEPSAWAIKVWREAGKEYAARMGDAEGRDNFHAAEMAAALVIEQALRAQPQAREDYSSLIAARCGALPGKLIDCPVCLAVDNERDRLAREEAQPVGFANAEFMRRLKNWRDGVPNSLRSDETFLKAVASESYPVALYLAPPTQPLAEGADAEKLRVAIEALEPFAEVNTAGWGDESPVDEMDGLTAKHLRRAAKALAALQQEGRPCA